LIIILKELGTGDYITHKFSTTKIWSQMMAFAGGVMLAIMGSCFLIFEKAWLDNSFET